MDVAIDDERHKGVGYSILSREKVALHPQSGRLLGAGLTGKCVCPLGVELYEFDFCTATTNATAGRNVEPAAMAKDYKMPARNGTYANLATNLSGQASYNPPGRKPRGSYSVFTRA